MSQSGRKPVRLFKALRELNVSVDTLVETLKENGFELDAKLEKGDINAKISPEMYEALHECIRRRHRCEGPVRASPFSSRPCRTNPFIPPSKRPLHRPRNSDPPKMNLKEAADRLGISKDVVVLLVKENAREFEEAGITFSRTFGNANSNATLFGSL